MNRNALHPSALRRLLRAGRQCWTQAAPYVSHPDRVTLGDSISMDPSTRFTVLNAEQTLEARIVLGDGVYLGRDVELTAAGGGGVQIGDDTSLQDGGIIYGDVQIGAHCLLGRNIFVASRGHNFRHRPTWLIRDQDAAVLDKLPNAGPRTVIEDDCWIGQGVVVMPGVYIGRGAVIGANCVVTRDVGPYEVHGGVPNRLIGKRLDFLPPRSINATEEGHLPYFYRGFALSRALLAQSRAQAGINVKGKALLVMAATDSSILKLCGHLAGGRLRLSVNGAEREVTASGDFTLHAEIGAAHDARPAPLFSHTLVEIAAEGGLAISTASIS